MKIEKIRKIGGKCENWENLEKSGKFGEIWKIWGNLEIKKKLEKIGKKTPKPLNEKGLT